MGDIQRIWFPQMVHLFRPVNGRRKLGAVRVDQDGFGDYVIYLTRTRRLKVRAANVVAVEEARVPSRCGVIGWITARLGGLRQSVEG